MQQPQATVVARSINVSHIKLYDIPCFGFFTVWSLFNALQLSHLPHPASDQNKSQAWSFYLDNSADGVFNWLAFLSADLAVLLCSTLY